MSDQLLEKINSDKLLEKINQVISIYDLVQEFNINVKKIGKNFMGLCPFHIEKTASFSVSVEKNIAVCMSCKKGGSPITFYKEIKKISFQQAVFELAKRLNLNNDFYPKNINPKQKFYNIIQESSNCFKFNLHKDKRGIKALDYLKKRQIEEKTINYFHLGYAFSHQEERNYSSLINYLKQKTYSFNNLLDLGLIKHNSKNNEYYDFFRGRLIFPISDFEGKIVGFAGRNLDNKEPIKYLLNQNTALFNKSNLLYQYYENKLDIKKQDQVIIYEGFFDVMISFQCNITNTVATMGTNLTSFQIKMLSKLTKEFVFAYDNDQAGQESFLKLGNLLHKKGFRVKRILFPDNLDPDEFYRKEGKEKYQKFIKDNVQDFLEIISDDILKKSKSVSLEKTKQKLLSLFVNQSSQIKTFYQTIFSQKYKIEINLFDSQIIKSPNVRLLDNNYFSISDLLNGIVSRNFLYQNWSNFINKYNQLLEKGNLVDSYQQYIYFLIPKIKKYYDLNPQAHFIPFETINDFLTIHKAPVFFINSLKKKIDYNHLTQQMNDLRSQVIQEQDEIKKQQILQKIKEIQCRKVKK